jgi:Tol biopolymer transport system component
VVRELRGEAERVLVADATLPRFSPDGGRLAFARSRAYAGGVGVVELAGGEPRWLTDSGTWPEWLPDGRGLAYADVGPEGTQLARRVGLDGGAPQPLGRYRWRSTHFPFALDRSGRTLVTTDDGDARSTLWLAEY